jgi:hypothetical protein
MSVVPDAGKRLLPALSNRRKKRAGVVGIGLEERLRLEVENLPFSPPLNNVHRARASSLHLLH